jgi:hypothetical protein
MPDPVWILQKNFRHEIVEIVRITDVLGLQDGNQALIGMFDRIPEGHPIALGSGDADTPDLKRRVKRTFLNRNRGLSGYYRSVGSEPGGRAKIHKRLDKFLLIW